MVFTATVLAVALGVAASASAVSGCSSASAPGSAKDAAPGTDSTAGQDTGTTQDSTTPVDSASTGDSSGPATDGASTADAPADTTSGGNDASDGGFPDGYIGVTGNIPVSQQVSALGVNLTTDTVYVAMVDLNGSSAGIAVLDDATGAVTTTIPPVTVDGGPVPPYFYQSSMAVDATNDLVYGVRQFGHVVDVFDGSTNAYKTTFDVDVLDPSAGTTINWIAVDGARSIFYASTGKLAPDTVVISVISTTGGTYSLTASIPLTDLQSDIGALALDTTNQLLFVSNSSPYFGQNPPPPLLVDQIDTATNQVTAGAQQSLGAGKSIGTVGGAGTAVLVAQVYSADAGPSDGGYNTGTFFSLEPGAAGMAFVPVAFNLCPIDATTFLVYGFVNGALAVGKVMVDPADLQPPTVLGSAEFYGAKLPAGSSVTTTDILCAKIHCYWNGSSFVSGGGNSEQYAWIVDALNACK